MWLPLILKFRPRRQHSVVWLPTAASRSVVDPVNILLTAHGSVSLAEPATAVEADVAYLAPGRGQTPCR